MGASGISGWFEARATPDWIAYGSVYWTGFAQYVIITERMSGHDTHSLIC